MNRFPFAPGVVSYARRGWFGSPAQRRELARWLKWSALWLAVVAAAALLAGVRAGVLA